MASEVTYAEVRFENESKSLGTKSEPPTAPKQKTSPHKSNSGFPKILFPSLLILLLLLAISFFIAFIIFFQKYAQLLKEKKTTKDFIHTKLECMKENLTMEEKYWSCCPKEWKSFKSNCYFISTKNRNWMESEKNCLGMKAHLLVINTNEEQTPNSYLTFHHVRTQPEGASYELGRGIYPTILVPQSGIPASRTGFINQFLEKKFAYYMGLSDPEGKRAWQWVDQTPYNESATFWHPGEPNNLNEHCVILNAPRQSSWGWNNVRCDEPHSSICKMVKIHL